ncbi:MAG TPA: hypothetical protein VJZ00_19205 [Thermoanaerobaculia bacterium]|nr:hypothetical protein [Thermoanaerobaculia bacterium]
MPSLHTLSGLTIASNVPLAGVPAAAPDVTPDLTIHFEPFTLDDRGDTLDEASPLFRLARLQDGYLFDFPDGVQYVVDQKGTRLAASWPPSLSAEIAATYLVSVIIAFVLRLRGFGVLHASVVLIDDEAVAIMGPSGAGKSTTAAALALRGARVIADDVAAIVDHGDRFDVVSSHTRLRLWSDSSEALFGELPFIADESWKRYYELGERFAAGRFPLRAVYTLEDRIAETPHIDEITGREAVVEVLANTFKHAPRDAEFMSADFDRAGRIARHVPIRLAAPSRHLDRASELADLILADARELRG